MSSSPSPADPGFIRAEAVLELLRQLARDRTVRRSPIAGSAFVRRSLERAGYTTSPDALDYELGRLVGELVETELGRLRARLGLPLAATEIEAARADFGAGQPMLEAWSAIYHLCLRPELGLDTFALCERLGLHPRTLQRRLRRGARLLAAELREREHAARRAERRERLWACLPEPGPRRLVGRERLVDLVVEGLTRGEPRALALAGVGGSGKSALARAAAERCLLEGGFEQLDWIQAAARGPAELSRRIDRRWRSLPPAPMLLVIDGVDRPELAEAVAAARSGLPPSVRILTTGRVGWAAWPAVRVLPLPPLDQRAALSLLRHEARARDLRDVAAAPAFELRALTAVTAGHPLAILRAVAELRASSPQRLAEDFAAGRGVAADLGAELWEAVWRQAGRPARAVVRAVVAARRAGRRATGLESARRSGLGRDAAEQALREAVDRGLLDRVEHPGDCAFHERPWLASYLDREPERAAALPLAQSAD